MPGPRRPTLLVTLVWLVSTTPGAAVQQADPPFERWFEARTLRVDYFHTGGPDGEVFALDRAVDDGPWAGPRDRLVDDTGLGAYRVQVRDPLSDRLLYSRGFGSLYGEWVTTAEARGRHRTFHESVRVPLPRAPVRLVIQDRSPDNRFREAWTLFLDPASPQVNRAPPPARGRPWTVFENGPPGEKVDLVILGEGYTEAELPRFHADVRRLVETLFATEPFRSRRSDFNVRAIDLPSGTSGVNRPHVGEFHRTPVSVEYNIFGSERYVLTRDNRALREVLSTVPYEFVEILVNGRQYGGGGIFGFQATTAAGTEFADYIFVHEFGHHFAGLADEYYTSPVAYETGGEHRPEPWEPNVTALHDPARLKWRDLVADSTPLPTPWGKERFEAHARDFRERREALIEADAPAAAFDSLFGAQRQIERRMMAEMRWAGQVGAFEGAMYEARGLYRPEVDCIMFTRIERFCAVCRRAIERIIDLYAG